jgi:hypothetical protein
MNIITILFILLKAKQREDAARAGAGTPHWYMEKYLNKLSDKKLNLIGMMAQGFVLRFSSSLRFLMLFL